MYQALLIPLVSLMVASDSPNGPSPVPAPRPCRTAVDVRFDTTVVNPGADSLVQFQIRGAGPEYPADLRSARSGRVIARFVVDTNGRVVPGSAMIVSESQRGFGQSVCRFLSQARFKAAVVNGRKLTAEVSAAPFTFQFGSRD